MRDDSRPTGPAGDRTDDPAPFLSDEENARQRREAERPSPRERLLRDEAAARAAGRGCTCYVARLTDVERFGTRFGAHELTCSMYRESLDPVDRMHDAAQRDHFTKAHHHGIIANQEEHDYIIMEGDTSARPPVLMVGVSLTRARKQPELFATSTAHAELGRCPECHKRIDAPLLGAAQRALLPGAPEFHAACLSARLARQEKTS